MLRGRALDGAVCTLPPGFEGVVASEAHFEDLSVSRTDDAAAAIDSREEDEGEDDDFDDDDAAAGGTHRSSRGGDELTGDSSWDAALQVDATFDRLVVW